MELKPTHCNTHMGVIKLHISSFIIICDMTKRIQRSPQRHFSKVAFEMNQTTSKLEWRYRILCRSTTTSLNKVDQADRLLLLSDRRAAWTNLTYNSLKR
jgi:hypothetical protein